MGAFLHCLSPVSQAQRLLMLSGHSAHARAGWSGRGLSLLGSQPKSFSSSENVS